MRTIFVDCPLYRVGAALALLGGSWSISLDQNTSSGLLRRFSFEYTYPLHRQFAVSLARAHLHRHHHHHLPLLRPLALRLVLSRA
jgi:hypothetical protein